MLDIFLRFSALVISSVLFTTFAAFPQGSPDTLWSVLGHASSVESISFSEDGQEVISGGGTEAKIWQAVDGSLLQTVSGYPEDLLSVSLSPDENYLAAGYVVGTFPPLGEMDIRELPQGNIVFNFDGSFVEFSENGELIASGGGGANRYADVHQVSNGLELGHYYNGPGYILDITFSPGGQLLAAACSDNTIKLWDVESGTLLRTLSGHIDDVRTIDFSPDGKLLASGAGGFDDPGEATIKLWQVSDGTLLRTLDGHGEFVWDVSFSPGGQFLISCGQDGFFPNVNPKIKIWQVSDGSLLKFYDQDLDPAVSSIDYSPDGQTYCYARSETVAVAVNPFVTAISNSPTIISAGDISLPQNYPNPFNPSTTIEYTLPAPMTVTIKVYNTVGQLVRTLVNGAQPAGVNSIMWDGKNDAGQPVSSGIYLCHLQVSSVSEQYSGQIWYRKMMLLK